MDNEWQAITALKFENLKGNHKQHLQRFGNKAQIGIWSVKAQIEAMKSGVASEMGNRMTRQAAITMATTKRQ